MSYNPPELKDELRDTLFLLGVEYSYETVKTDEGIIRSFHLKATDQYLDIYGPKFIKYRKRKYTSTYHVKLALIDEFLS